MAVKFDIKSFFVNHCEKVIACVVAMIALWGFASASWEHASERPEMLIANADKVEEQIEGKTEWPSEEQDKFVITRSISRLAADLGERDELDIEKFAMHNPWLEPLNPLREKRQNVVVLPPEAPEINAFTVALAFPADEAELEPVKDTSGSKDDTKKEMTDIERRALEQFGGNAPDGASSVPVGRPAGLALNLSLFGSGQEGRSGRGLMGLSRGKGKYADDDDDDYAGVGVANDINTTGAREVEWRAGVSVRMLVNLRKQRREIANALHLSASDTAMVEHYLDYKEIHIERQEYRRGEWSEWEQVLLEDLVEILDETLGSDVDVVSPAVTRSVITMPLPRRAAGIWGANQASHSRLEDFELDPDEREMINRIVAITAQQAAEAAEREESLGPQRGGFGSHIQDQRDLRSTARASGNFRNEEELNDSIRKIAQEAIGENDGEFSERQKEIFDQQISQLSNEELDGSDRLLLVRFMDFTAERGVTYRYRVRLEMFNPNFGQVVDTLESPELANKESLFSDWSQPTDEATVPMRYRNYIRSVKLSPADLKSMRAQVGVYYEDDGILPIIGATEVEVGMPIGGKSSPERVDLEKMVLEKGEVNLSTDEFLCGIVSNPNLTASDHSDFEQELRQLRRGFRPVSDVVCLVDQNGDLVLKEVDENASALEVEEQLVEQIIANYDSWRPGADNAAFGYGDDDDDDDDYWKGKGKGRNRGLGMNEGNVLSTASGSRGGKRGKRGK